MALYLARLLQQQGKRVAVLSRGYRGAASASVNVVSDGSNILLNPQEAGDEPFFLAERLPGIPVLTGKDRGVAGEYAQRNLAAEVVVLDDGFQHIRLRRDVDIILLDRERPFGNGHLLPRGPLREPPHSIRRAHIALATQPHGSDKESQEGFEKGIHRYNSTIPIFYAHYTPLSLTRLSGEEQTSCEYLKGRPVIALAGIGRPDSFSDLLLTLGARVVETRFFPDHHSYQIEEVGGLNGEAIIVTTEKDAVKLKSLKLSEKNIRVLSIALSIDREAAFITCLKKYLPSLF